MEDKEDKKEMFKEKICRTCVNKDNCTKDKMVVKRNNDKTSYRCYTYQFIDLHE